MSEFKDRISDLPSLLGLKVKDFHDAIGITGTSFYQLKKGDSKPSFDTIASILEAFPEISPYWLIHGKGQPIMPESAITDSKQLLFDIRNLVDKVSEMDAQLKEMQNRLKEK